MDFEKIKQAAQNYLPDMTKFLRDLIAIPSESCEEEGVIRRTIEEMNKLGFDRAEIDPQGNALGYMGNGPRLIAFDGHIDTVGIGNRDNWKFDPYAALRPKPRSAAGAVPTRKAASSPRYTAPRS
mgnify:CR=1 FL=1